MGETAFFFCDQLHYTKTTQQWHEARHGYSSTAPFKGTNGTYTPHTTRTHLHEEGLELSAVPHLLLAAPALLRAQCRNRPRHPRVCHKKKKHRPREITMQQENKKTLPALGGRE